MEQKVLQGALRTETGKGPVGRLRRNGKIPAVIYGHEKSHAITIDAREFGRKFRTISENTIITVETSGGNHDVLVKDYQEDLLTGKITHIDFYEIVSDRLLRTHVPVRMKGTSPGVREGGVLETLLHDIEIECYPKDIPESFEIDISGLAIGNSIHVSDLSVPKDARILNALDQVVVTVAHQRIEIVEPTAAEAAAEGEEAAAAAEAGVAAETPTAED
ncbi:MAG TPA: 50S ribosomal protein L25 [Spirochaetia bacterium]|nr:50S ribosomal protein L25 [Spirochaetia bacterium]